MSAAAPLVLIDNPDDDCCEEIGWVEAVVDNPRARDLLTRVTIGQVRPAGMAKKVWLRPHDTEPDMWEVVGETEFDGARADGAREFWQITVH